MIQHNKPEQPLDGWPAFARYLKCSVPTAKKRIKEKKIKVVMFGNKPFAYPSTIQKQLEEAMEPLD